MTEFEWMRELNEGVKKIYADMADAGLPALKYVETPNTVKRILRNNMDERTAHRNKASGEALNDAINEAEKLILEVIRKSPRASQVEIAEMTGFSRSKVQRSMKKLVEKRAISRDGARKNGIWIISNGESGKGGW